MDEEIAGRLSPYVRRPKRALLPGSPAPLPLRRRIGDFFLFRFLTALPDDLADAVAALLDPFQRTARLAGRLLHGPALRGGWASRAGRFALALHGFHWAHWQAETEGPGGLFTARRIDGPVAAGTVTARPPWGRGDPARGAHTAVCSLRRVPRLRRRPARVDLVFTDGSWLALRMGSRADAARLRAALGPARGSEAPGATPPPSAPAGARGAGPGPEIGVRAGRDTP
ncbi:hypothetical protein AW27_006940 [Streptomyces sp. PCS3-D2]|uniref:hypothetical protein n=1 Tax=Streptomyces sp. PCS3-D2 TaxID=1460244 RepID=UPI000446E4F5|nr:hypothetical protein [Streptomyces sp. PCS3-D2]WKV71291.1 hypothetical protein AW27_006940 [Streptomyces sp. PCS3-D2]